MRSISLTALVIALVAAFPAGAGAMGLPGTFPRTITITGTKQSVRVTRFEVTTRASGTKKARVTVRVGAVSLKGSRQLLIAVAPCVRGDSTASPYCKPAATAKLRLGATELQATRSFLVPRPARKPDALRVTLTAGGAKVPYLSRNVGGGGGTAELLLNGGTWRFHQGTAWGLTSTVPQGVVLDRVWFNSRRYEWGGTASAETPVSTTIGYAGLAPVWNFSNTMRAGKPFSFYRTPSRPVQAVRKAPVDFRYAASAGGAPLFTVRLPLPAWAGE
jgi:hypothetical protein